MCVHIHRQAHPATSMLPRTYSVTCMCHYTDVKVSFLLKFLSWQQHGELVRNAKSQPLPQPSWIRTCSFDKVPTWFVCTLKFKQGWFFSSISALAYCVWGCRTVLSKCLHLRLDSTVKLLIIYMLMELLLFFFYAKKDSAGHCLVGLQCVVCMYSQGVEGTWSHVCTRHFPLFMGWWPAVTGIASHYVHWMESLFNFFEVTDDAEMGREIVH